MLAVFLFASPERWQLWNAEFEELPTSTTPSDDEELPFDGLQDEEGSGDGDTIPPDAAIDNELNDSTRGEPEADAPTDPDHIGVVREAREGATSGMPTANVALQGFQYTVTVDLNEDDLGARVRRQFLERVETDADGRLIVWFERDEFEQGLLRLSELGTVERERVGLDPSELRVGVVVQSAPAD